MIRISPIKSSRDPDEGWTCDGCGLNATQRITALAASRGGEARTLEFCDRCLGVLARRVAATVEHG